MVYLLSVLLEAAVVAVVVVAATGSFLKCLRNGIFVSCMSSSKNAQNVFLVT